MSKTTALPKELITPATKVTHPNSIWNLRKISSTSNYSKLFEGFIKVRILEDISVKKDIGQFGVQKDSGTEILLGSLVDRNKRILECSD